MATIFYLRDAASDLGGSGQKALVTTRGETAVNAVTNTVASGTAVFVTDTPGGTALAWFTPPLIGLTISGSVTVNIRGLESNGAANTAPGIVIDRCDTNGIPLSNIFTTASTVEWDIVDGTQNGSFPATSTTLSNGDRIRVLLASVNIGTMAGGFTFTNSYNGPTTDAAGDTFVAFSETITLYNQAGMPWFGFINN